MLSSDQKDVLWVLGYFYLENMKFDKAYVIFRALYCLDPDDVRILGAYASACFQAGHNHEALHHATAFFEGCSQKDKTDAAFLLAKIMWKNGDRERAARYLKHFATEKEPVDGNE